MAGMSTVKQLRQRFLAIADKLSFVGPALARLTVGVVFAQSGWSKLHGLADLTRFFTDLHIPAPGFNATLVASTEFVGGVLLLLGLFSRLAAAPLAFTMVIAILTAKRDDIEGIGDLLGFSEFSYLVFFLWILVAGAGALSLDHLIARRFLDREPPTAATGQPGPGQASG